MRLRIGSRGSQLALWQANHVSEGLGRLGHDVEVEVIHTTGDRGADTGPGKVSGKGLFTKEIEEALAQGRVDLAVHSLKDLPTDIADQFEIAAVPRREDPRDAFCSLQYSSIEELPRAARVGTSSLRRQAQLKRIRQDLTVQPLSGNVDTRLRKLETGEYHAVILAVAGLNRLRRTERVRQILPVTLLCPAAGQGALAIEIRRGDSSVREAVIALDHRSSRLETDCERALLRKLGGGCQVPIGANARSENDGLELRAVIAKPDGSLVLSELLAGRDAVELGERAGKNLLRRGARRILEEVYGQPVSIPEQP